MNKNTFRQIYQTVFGNQLKYSGKEGQFMNITFEPKVKPHAHTMHRMFGHELGIWNKHRKENSKKLMRSAQFRQELFQKNFQFV